MMSAARGRTVSQSPPGASACLRWAREFLPHYFSEAPADFHAELLGALETSSRDFH